MNKFNSKLQPTRCNVSWFIYFYRRSTCFMRSSTHHQEHITVQTASGIVNQYCCYLGRDGTSAISSTVAGCSSIGWQYLKLYIQLCVPDDGRRNRYCCYRGRDDTSAISSTVAASNSTDWQYIKLYLQLCAPDDGRRNRLKRAERL